MLSLTVTQFWIAAAAVIFTGISKSGFGGGAGILATPLLALVMPARDAVGVLLPLLILSDCVSVWFYRRDWLVDPIKFIAGGIVAGIAVGIILFGVIDDRWLKIILGAICLGFCVLQALRSWLLAKEEGYRPGYVSGTLFGAATGLTSTLAHAAGPVMAMYLLPQNLAPANYMGTNVVAFAAINLLKLPGYIFEGLVSMRTLPYTLALSPFVLLGTAIGLWSNKHVSKTVFNRVVYTFLFLSGLELIAGQSLLKAGWVWLLG